jgi:hypothetical protein
LKKLLSKRTKKTKKKRLKLIQSMIMMKSLLTRSPRMKKIRLMNQLRSKLRKKPKKLPKKNPKNKLKRVSNQKQKRQRL